MGTKLFEDLLTQKALDYEQFTGADSQAKGADKGLRETSDEVVLEGKAFKSTKLLAEDLLHGNYTLFLFFCV